jgi:hypothetical protein
VMRREALREESVHGFQFVFVSPSIACVVAFSSGDYGQSCDENELKKLASVVLKNIPDPVFGCEFLVFSYIRKDAL